MSNYGIRHDPKVIAIAILTMIFPGIVDKKILKEAGVEVSEKTLQRIRNDVRELGIDKLVKDTHKLYLLANIDSQIDSMKLKNHMFSIITSSDSTNMDKIQAAKVINDINKNVPNIHDPLLAESISKIEGEEDDSAEDATGVNA